MIVVVDYGTGNLGSLLNIGKRADGEIVFSDDPEVIRQAPRLVLPGVGAFDAGMEGLRRRGLVDALNEAVLEREAPVLGICLGFQLMMSASEEGRFPGLGWIDGEVVRFRFDAGRSRLKIPHMGWNYVDAGAGSVLFENMHSAPRFYFAHSFHAECGNLEDVLGWTTYGYRFASAIRRRNIWGTQFHPEKSHRFGLTLMKNFFGA